jgi:hypothetical protein
VGCDVMELQTAVLQHCYHPCTYKGEGEAGSGVGGRVWGSSLKRGAPLKTRVSCRLRLSQLHVKSKIMVKVKVGIWLLVRIYGGKIL